MSSRLYVRTLAALKTQAARLYVLHGTVKTRAEPQLKNRFARGADRRGEAFIKRRARPQRLARYAASFDHEYDVEQGQQTRNQSPSRRRRDPLNDTYAHINADGSTQERRVRAERRHGVRRAFSKKNAGRIEVEAAEVQAQAPEEVEERVRDDEERLQQRLALALAGTSSTGCAR